MNRDDFPMLDGNLIYLDNGATTFKPKCVINAISDYYSNYCANCHRGDYNISLKVDDLYENTRKLVKEFIHAKNREEIVFTKGTTESINLIVFGFMKYYLHEGDEVLITKMEHASNVLPWFILEKEIGIKVKFIPLVNHLVTIDSIKKSITNKTKVISLAYITNTYGDIRDIKKITKLAHTYNILICVDGAQSVPHIKTDVINLDIDFLSFSAHKMLGPTGVGVLYGKNNLLKYMHPINYGGGMNEMFSSDKNYSFKHLPWLHEAGTPNVAGILGFSESIRYLLQVGMDNIYKHELLLKKYLIYRLKEIPNIIIYNPNTTSGIVLFNLNNVYSWDMSKYLNKYNICVRAGNHCAKMVKEELFVKNTCRISLYFYNTKEEIDKLINILKNYSVK